MAYDSKVLEAEAKAESLLACQDSRELPQIDLRPKTTRKKTYSFQWTERLETQTAQANVLNACINLHLLRAVQAAAGTGSEGCWVDVSSSLDSH